MTLYFEDFSVGDVYDVGTVEMERDEMVAFAERFDPQPFHVDEEAARDSMFGELVASGLHTLCVAGKLFVSEFVQAEDVANMGGSGFGPVRFHAPVRPGDGLRLKIEAIDVRTSESRSDRGYVDFEYTTYVEGDGTDVLSTVSKNIVRRRD